MATSFNLGTLALSGLFLSKSAFAITELSSDIDKDKPNIVFILVDDMGYECIGAYGGTYNTPNIDQLAEKGIQFNYAFSTPLSTPSRVQVLTGKYNHKNYVDFGFLNQDQKTFGNLAKDAGYKTAIVGKWQLGFNSKLPAHFGFDNHCLWQLSYYRQNIQSERYANALIEQDGKILERDKNCYGPDIFVDYIEKFIEENKNTPFFLYYPMVLVHDPFVVTPMNADWESLKSSYKSDPGFFPEMMEYMDRIVRRIIDKLKEEKLFENTLIVFTADNGTSRKITSPMKDGSMIRGGKGTTTDAGTHVPLIISFGDQQAKPSECNDLVDFTDFLPTFADAMGVKVPKEWDTDGISFLPQVRGDKKKITPREWVFCHYDSFFRGADQPSKDARRFIRNHRYKLYSTGEFYDIETDPLEKEDIAHKKGSREAEKARKFLSKELSRFPKWKVGDITTQKVTYEGLESERLIWNRK